MKRKKRASTKTKINNEYNKSKVDEYYRGLSSAMMKSIKESGFLEEFAKFYREDPLNAELMLAAELKEVCRSLLEDQIKLLDQGESSLPKKGKSCRKT